VERKTAVPDCGKTGMVSLPQAAHDNEPTIQLIRMALRSLKPHTASASIVGPATWPWTRRRVALPLFLRVKCALPSLQLGDQLFWSDQL
jgi:hypothetical protein